ncbi:HAD-IA family hydrolase [Globicatella sp. PHS-GS-PNBC-21-1553]|uniref:HAD family hydrolase n=1 Tax=Globicatella sp. PHS-GS-PNBC-21-1553 TaxID=2885764 RepID=UPI00298F22E4|nr:HAD-IA family hydrolase [Globicatella sp. PHS-GS-PNBC-21-1553]
MLNLEKYFDKIIVTDELGRAYWKPHPKSFEIMKAHFGVNYNEMVYVGDNPQKDFFIKKSIPLKQSE